MTAEPGSDPKLEIAHVLTMDVIEYSTLLITEQSRVMAELKRIVRDTSRFRRADAESKLICLPTGDGMVLVFFNDPEAPIECAMEISAALRSRPEIRLRMGIHSGPVNQVLDVNERSNVAGAGVDMAQRVMDCGDAGHILLSKRVADDLAPFPRWNPHLHELGECQIKHERKISLVNFYTENIGNPEPPQKCAGSEKKLAAVANESLFRQKRALIFAAALLLVTVIIGFFAFFHQTGPKKGATPTALSPQINTKSIAVLPFENLSRDPDNAYFADGIQEEILTRLSKISDLKVISRTSTQRYKSAPHKLSEIAKQLGVAHILEGSAQRAGDQVRVNVQLINAETDAHLWAETYDRKLTDIFAVESEVATKIAETLQAKLTGAERNAIATRPTENNEAHQAYLKGLYWWYKYPAPGFEKCRDYFQQAVDLDPTYAPGYSGLSYYFGFTAAIGLAPPNENWPTAAAAAKKALELDDTLPDAYNTLAAAKLYYERDWPAAERLFRRGIELDPNSAEIRHHYATCLILFQRNDEALNYLQRAAELDPLALRNNLDRANIFLMLRQYDRAIDQYRKTLELDPNFPVAHEWLGYAYEKKGMQKEAIAQWSKALVLSGESDNASILEHTFAKSGFEKAVRVLAQKRLERLKARNDEGKYVPASEYAMVYARLGDKEQTFAWLDKAVEERNRFALELKIRPVFDNLRDDPRFQALLRRVGLTQ